MPFRISFLFGQFLVSRKYKPKRKPSLIVRVNKDKGQLIDRIFKKVLQSLNEDIEGIYVKKFLREKIKTKVFLDDGWLKYDDNDNLYIYLSARNHGNSRRAMAKTLLHEVLHFLYPKLREQSVLKLEDLVWKRLNEKQKAALIAYVPKHMVKN